MPGITHRGGRPRVHVPALQAALDEHLDTMAMVIRHHGEERKILIRMKHQSERLERLLVAATSQGPEAA